MRNALCIIAGLAALTLSTEASATNYTLWIHGRNSGGTPSGVSYWSHAGWAANPAWACTCADQAGGNQCGCAQATASGLVAGVNAVAVDYDGSAHISATNGVIVTALNAFCTGGNSCYVTCHSAGCAQLGYAFAYSFNPSNPWNVIWVVTGGSAAGGSELANAGSWLTGYDIDSDLHTGTVRAMYNHDLLGDHTMGWVYTVLGGDWSSATNTIFPCHSSTWGVCYSWAANDSVEAFHSTGHFRQVSGTQSDTNTGGSISGGSWWDHTLALFVDGNNGSYGHCIVGSYPCQEGGSGGIMGVVSPLMAQYAR